jgi:L-threonate 2-dehydrogenase
MSTPKQVNVGLIGLGAMGAGMAGSLRRNGYNVHVYDIRPEAVTGFTAGGGIACASAQAVASSCPIVVSVLVNAAQTEHLLFGEAGIAATMQPGSVFVMCSTVDPNVSIQWADRLEALGIH